MDFTTILIIVAVIALAALYFYNRSRPAPRGTYDDKEVRSSGSIGGGTRAYDDEEVRSSGSIGGGTRAYDTPEHASRGSIGGQRTDERNRNGVGSQNSLREDVRDEESFLHDETLREDDGTARPTHNDKRHKSGGSFGA